MNAEDNGSYYYNPMQYHHWVPPYGWASPYAPCVCPCCGRCRNDRVYIPWQPYWQWNYGTITVTNVPPESSDVAA